VEAERNIKIVTEKINKKVIYHWNFFIVPFVSGNNSGVDFYLQPLSLQPYFQPNFSDKKTSVAKDTTHTNLITSLKNRLIIR
jgi:hypothetical protein